MNMNMMQQMVEEESLEKGNTPNEPNPQQEFNRAYRNHFFNDDAVKRFAQIAKANLNIRLARHQAVRLLDDFWADKKVRNKKHFHEISNDEIVQWLTTFIKEHKGEE